MYMLYTARGTSIVGKYNSITLYVRWHSRTAVYSFKVNPRCMCVCVCLCAFFFSSLCYLFISRFMQLCIWMWAAWAVGIGHLFLHNRLSPLYMICDYVRPVLSVSSFILVRRLGRFSTLSYIEKFFFLDKQWAFLTGDTSICFWWWDFNYGLGGILILCLSFILSAINWT